MDVFAAPSCQLPDFVENHTAAARRRGSSIFWRSPWAQSCNQSETNMANREQRGNREKRKKKADKLKPPAAQTSPFAHLQKPADRSKPGAGQKRK
jgi:hypothetical protein